MAAEHESQHWRAIVGDHWPAIPPADWRRLQTVATDAADIVDPGEADRARRMFSDRVRASVGLQPAMDDMLDQQGSVRAMVDALVAAGDTFGQIADTVHRTRNQILDIVDRADADVRDVRQQDSDDGENDDRRRRIAEIVQQARDNVADVEHTALTRLGPQGLPELQMLTELLGQPNPWVSGGGGAGHSPRPAHHGGDGSAFDDAHFDDARDPAGPPGEGGRHLVVPPFGPMPFAPGLIRLGPGPFPHDSMDVADDPVHRVDDRSPGPGSDQVVLPPSSPGAGAPQGPVVSGGGYGYGTGAGVAPTPGGPADPAYGGDGGFSHRDAPDVAAAPDSPDTTVAARVSDTPSEHDTDTSEQGTEVLGGSVTRRSAATDDDVTAENPSGPVGIATAGSGIISAMATGLAQSSMPIAKTGPGFAVPGPTAPVTPSGAPHHSAAVSSTEPRVTASSEARSPAAGSKVSAGAGPAAGAVTSNANVAPPRVPSADDSGSSDTTPGAGDSGSDDVVRDAVGGAMVAAAAPAFVLGERVDGDLVLARSLLSSLLAAIGETALGVEWAVAVLRHSGGVSAFVTSNEGRGWLPPRLFLPRELSTPWVWSESAGDAWEGIADPARVLAEFGLAWGAKTGARLSALVSSPPMDPGLAQQLGPTATEGSVTAAAVMDFGTAAAGLADRLELVGSPELVRRAAAVPPDRIGERLLDLARDGQARVGQVGQAALDSLGASRIRRQILHVAAERGQVPDPWWDELRDADALVAASMLALRVDVSRVTLGELRSGAGRTGGGATGLRAMVCERRCDELVLLLAEEPTRQTLRDAIYAHGQLAQQQPVDRPRPDVSAAPPGRRSSISAGPRR